MLISAERYQFVRELGSGAFARVWLALDQLTSKLVAVKTLHSGMVLSGGMRLRREFRALQRLEHPNIVRVYDWLEDVPPALVMEFIDGVTLKAFLEQQPSLAQIVQIFSEVLEALATVHHQGLLHRDLKPENIMVKNNSAKLMDFGLTKSSQESLKLTREGGVVGTALFMSPEQCRGWELDPRSDLYALGAVMYLAFTGTVPFTGRNLPEVLLGHIQGTLTPPRQLNPDLPVALERVVTGLLEKNPAQRPSSALQARQLLLEAFETPNTLSLELPQVRADALLRAPLIGRNQEMQALRTALENTGVLLLSGAAGIGKTRLLNAFIENSSIGQRLVTGLCLPDDVMPFGACARFLAKLQKHHANLLDTLPASIKLELARIAPGFDETSSLETGLEADVASLRLFEAFAGLLESISETVIAVFENLHWADNSTSRLLAHVARSRPELKLILTYRTDDLPMNLSQAFKLEKSQHIQLLPLSDAAMRELIKALLGLETEMVLEQHLLENASGNPWVLEENIKALLETGAINQRLGVFEWNRNIPPPPKSVQELIESRLRNLPRPSLEFAQASSILGDTFRFSDTLALLEWQEEPALEALEELIRAKIVLELRGDDTFRFQHPIFSDVLRGQIIQLRRRRWHAKAAQQLEGRGEALSLAAHYLASDGFEAALKNAFLAGNQALARLAFGQAERAYRIALQSAGSLNNENQKCQAKFYLANALNALGQTIQAKQYWREIMASTDNQFKTQARLELAKALSAAGDPEALNLIVELTAHDPLYLESCLAYSLILRNTKDLVGSQAFALKAYKTAVVNNDLQRKALALIQLARVAYDQTQYERSEMLVRVGLKILKNTKFHRIQAQLYNLLGSVVQARSDWNNAQEYFLVATQIAQESRDLEIQAHALNNSALGYFMTNQFDLALGQYQQAKRIAKRSELKDSEKITSENIILCHYLLNQIDLAKAEALALPSSAMAGLWSARIQLERGELQTLALPTREELHSWNYFFLVFVQTQIALVRKDYAQALVLSEHQNDFSWFWVLFRVHSKWKLGLDFEADLNNLSAAQIDPGINPELALEYTKFIRAALTEPQNRSEILRQAQIYASSSLGIFAREVLVTL